MANATIQICACVGLCRFLGAVKERVSGWEARVIMHENDHLNGALFVDRLEGEGKKNLEPFLRALDERMFDINKL